MERSKIKKDTLVHYDRMIAWADQPNRDNNEVNSRDMWNIIHEDWFGDYCPYCRKYYNSANWFNECHKCPLCANKEPEGNDMDYCCDGLWTKMSNSKTWDEWVKNAKLVREYIEQHG